MLGNGKGMKARRMRALFLGTALAAAAVCGCHSTSSSTTTTVTISPPSTVLVINQTDTFTATVAGPTNTAVTWTLTASGCAASTQTETSTQTKPTPTCGGSISNWTNNTTGTNSVLFTAPSVVPTPTPSTATVTITLEAVSTEVSTASGTATIFISSGVTVTVSPSSATLNGTETFPFTATVTNDAGNKGVTWTVTTSGGTMNPATSTNCTVGKTGTPPPDTCTSTYTAPQTAGTYTITATSVADTSISGSASVTVVNASPVKPTITGISPHSMGVGSVLQDLYINGTNFLSTTTVFLCAPASCPPPANQSPFPSTQIVVPNSNVIRLRFTADPTTDTTGVLLAPGTYTVYIQQQVPQGGAPQPQTCTATPACGTFTVEPVRPGLVAASPASTPQLNASSSVQMQIDGGFFGPPSNDLVSITLGGSVAGTVQSPQGSNARQLNVNLSSNTLSTPGLVPLGVQLTNSNPPIEAVTNIAVQPDPTVNKLPASQTLSLPGGATAEPSGIALDSPIGVGVVALSGRDSVELINLGPSPSRPGFPTASAEISVNGSPAPIAPPCSPCDPVGVAVDDHLHLAAVVNVLGRSVSIVDLQGQALLGKIDLSPISPQWSSGTPAAPAPAIFPVGVGIDTNLHEGLVTFVADAPFNSGYIGAIINIGPSLPAGVSCLPVTSPAPAGPYCITGVVSLNDGTDPQAAFEPRLRWMAVSPGGSGVFSAVNLAQPVSAVPIATTANNGLTRTASGLITVNVDTTNSCPSGTPPSSPGCLTLDPLQPGSVLIEGAADPSFNGSYSVAPSNSTTPTITSTSFTIQLVCGLTGTPVCPPTGASGSGTVYFSEPLFTITLGNPTLRGIAINPVTHTAVLSDPNGNSVYFVNLLRQLAFQTSPQTQTGLGNVAASFQPYSNVAVVVNCPGCASQQSLPGTMMLFDPGAPSLLGGGTTITVGTNAVATGNNPVAVAIDPPTNQALVANLADGSLTVISLGTIKPVQISEVIVPQQSPALPSGYVYTSSTGVTLTVNGLGFSNSGVYLDGTLVAAGSGSSRQLTVTIPATFLASPRRYSLEVSNDGVTFSNSEDFTVVGAVPVPCTSATGASQLSAVAAGELYDPTLTQPGDRDIAVVTDAACDTASLVDIGPNTQNDPQGGTVIATVPVGVAPEGVAVSSRLGLAVVTNRNIDLTTLLPTGTGSLSIVNLNNPAATPVTVNVGSEPLGVDIDQDNGSAVIANFDSSSLTIIPDITASTPAPTSIAVTEGPLAVAVDSPDHLAVVTSPFATTAGNGEILVVDLLSNSITNTFLTTGIVLTDAVFDPVTSDFYVTSTDLKAVYTVTPLTGASPGVPTPVGITPASLAFNYQTNTLAALDPQSNAMITLDGNGLSAQTIFGPVNGLTPQSLSASTGAQQFSVAVNPRTNLAVVVDQPNGRLLLVPLPH